jgi:peptidyl-prolyl cis-trans isomerase B (cyclophilin B)
MTTDRRRLLIGGAAVTTVLLAAVIVVVVATSGGGRHAAGSCSWMSEGGAAKHVAEPPADPPHSGKVTVDVSTSRGSMTFTLDRALAPCTVASFVSLAHQHYFDSTPCHRLVTDTIYVLQCGDPTGSGSGGPGYTIPDEASGAETYGAATIAMARTADAHSGGSQFFIVYQDSPNLQRNLGHQQYTVFGSVSAGMGVVTNVAAAGTVDGGIDGRPKLPITLTTVTAR